MSPFSLADVETAAGQAGLRLRGAFHPNCEDKVPDVRGVPAGTLVLLGNVGGSMWPTIARSGYLDGRPDPIDDWSRDTIDALANTLSAVALYPFGGPPFLPFLRWAQRAEAVFPSRMGPLIHPDYGLWHAYRGALVFPERMALPIPSTVLSPCDMCVDKPCLSCCPVDAIADGHYDVVSCANFAASLEGMQCVEYGCAARRACPVGQAFSYPQKQARHHMTVFVDNVRRRGLG